MSHASPRRVRASESESVPGSEPSRESSTSPQYRSVTVPRRDSALASPSHRLIAGALWKEKMSFNGKASSSFQT